MTVFITEAGAVVRQSSQHLVVTKNNKRIAHVPLINTERIVLFGNVQLTTQAINLLLREGIDVAFLTAGGRLRGRLVAAESKNIFLRLAQYERHHDAAYQLATARSLVAGKLRNARAFLRLFQKNNPGADFTPELAVLADALTKLDRHATVSRLLGAEGSSTAAYFRAYGRMFRSELRFETRTKRPPKDPVNALLSLGYSLLTNEVLALVIASGLDPYLGFLHSLVYGRPSLALDLVEEFRHPLIDRFTLNLFNNEFFGPGDFRPVENEGIYLNDEAFKRYLRLYEQHLRAPLTAAADNGEAPAARDRIKKQVQRMAKCINAGEIYCPFQMTW